MGGDPTCGSPPENPPPGYRPSGDPPERWAPFLYMLSVRSLRRHHKRAKSFNHATPHLDIVELGLCARLQELRDAALCVAQGLRRRRAEGVHAPGVRLRDVAGQEATTSRV